MVEAQVQGDEGSVAAVQRGQRLAQELRPVVVDVVVPQRQVSDPGTEARRKRVAGNTGY